MRYSFFQRKQESSMKLTLAVLVGICLIWSTSDAIVHGYANQGRVAVGNRSVNQNVNVNRNANVNRNVNVNNNVNVNRNVNVHGGYYGGGCCYYHDDPNWGAFAAGAAVGVATTAAVAAATSHPSTTTVVVQAPPMGATVGVLPGGCSTVSAGGAVIYNCNNVYYRPFYQGTSLVYQVVTYP
jgi:hypothetical protein